MISRIVLSAVFVAALAVVLPGLCAAQTAPKGRNAISTKAADSSLPKVKQIDIEGLRKLLKPNGKPVLINFWATWCDPCREEFPDLVKLDTVYKGKVDFITVSLDELSEINTYVPKFLKEMNAGMPAYLLKTPDESAAIAMVSKEWAGNLPFTVLIASTGETSYVRKGKIRYAEATAEIDKALALNQSSVKIFSTLDFVKFKDGKRDEALYYYENNWKIYRDAAVKRGVIDSYELVESKSENNSLFDLILITRYRGEEMYRNSEKNFEPILKELRPNGPILKSDLKPDEFRQSVFLYNGNTVFSSVK